MPTIGGYGLSSLSGTVSLNLAKSQSRLQTDVSRLSSGLRINSAADDPSGLAIAEGLRAKVNGFDQAASNVQDATNALTVADGALQTVTDILQRLRSLTVQANDDLLSATDRGNIQTESTQLQAEIDTIAESTNFNGVHLLNRNPYVSPPSLQDSTFATTPSLSTGSYSPVGSTWAFSPYAAGGSGIANVTWAETTDGLSQPPPSGSTQVGILDGGGTAGVGGAAPTVSQSVSGFTQGASYTISFNAVQNSVNASTGRTPQSIAVLVDGTQIASYVPIETNPAAPEWTTFTTPAFAPGAGPHTIELAGVAGYGGAFIDDIRLIAVSEPQQPDLQIHDGANEGNVTSVQLPTVFTSNLGIAADTVVNSASAATYEGNLDTALDVVDIARAVLGAQMVRLQYQASNDNTAATNLTGSESNIRDADIARTTTAFAADQILNSIGTSVLANIKTQAALVEKLFQ